MHALSAFNFNLVTENRTMTRGAWHRAVVVAILAVGCRPAGPPADTAEQAGSPAADKAAAELPDAKETVESFLTALFAGDSEQALAMLTPQARMASTEADLELEAPGSANARFEVTEVATPEDAPDKAHVWTVLTDRNERGDDEAYDIVWLLRQNSESRWQVFGMATTVFEERLPLLLNFEDPQDVLAKRQWVRQQYELRAARAAQTVPPDSSTEQR